MIEFKENISSRPTKRVDPKFVGDIFGKIPFALGVATGTFRPHFFRYLIRGVRTRFASEWIFIGCHYRADEGEGEGVAEEALCAEFMTI